jgi:flagellar motility protein MotE (MotC chaperone)
MSGYDQFFKEANKAARPTQKASSKPTFKLPKQEQRPGTAEDRLRREIALRAKGRRKASMRKRQAFPVLPAIIAVVALISCTIGFVRPDLADQIFSHVDFGFFGKANAADAVKKDAKPVVAKPSADAAKTAETKDAVAAKPVETAKAEMPADFRTWTDEELSFFNKLNDRKKELDVREADLGKLEEELQKQKAELDTKLKQLEAMRADISKTLKSRVEVDQEKVEKLVQFYSTMKPQQAAKVIESLNEDLAVEVMDKMKKKSAAEIMNALKPEKARRLSEMLTGYQRSPASDEEKSE